MKKVLVLLFAAVMMVSVFAFGGCDDHEHSLTKHDAVVATCDGDGNSVYYSCDCGKYFSDAEGTKEIEKDSWIISATGHTLTKHDAVVATCETDGSSLYYSCVCGKYFEDAEGTKEIEKDSWIISATGHTLTKHDAVAATCETDGNSLYYSCTCGKYFSDAEGKNEVQENSWVIGALEHSYGDDAKCVNNCGDVLTDEEMVKLDYVAKIGGKYYKSIDQALTVGGTVELICDIDVLTDSDFMGYAYGAWLNNGEINGNGKALEMTFGDNNKFAGLWLLENATGVKNLVIVGDTKTAVYVEDLTSDVVIEGVEITTAGSGIHTERCANVVLKNVKVVSSNVAGYKAAVFAGDGAKVVVESGKYQAENAILTGGLNGAGITVKGGEFIGNIVVNGEDTLIIEGGTFSVNPSQWVADGYVAKANADGTWSVVECKEVATTSQLTSAISKGGYVRLTENLSLTTQLTFNKETTIDLNGNTLTTTQGAYNKLFFAKNNLNVISSVAGAKIELGNAGLIQVSSDYPDSVVNLENITINRTATSGTDLVLNYGTLNVKNVVFNLPGGSIQIFNTYGDLTLGEGTEVNVDGVLGTSLINNNGAVNVLIDGARINIDSFRVNGGALFSRNKGSSFVIEDIELNIVLDETYTSRFLNTTEGLDGNDTELVQLKGGTYNVTGASGTYSVGADGKWVLAE